jgi:hypothetical protein
MCLGAGHPNVPINTSDRCLHLKSQTARCRLGYWMAMDVGGDQVTDRSPDSHADVANQKYSNAHFVKRGRQKSQTKAAIYCTGP